MGTEQKNTGVFICAGCEIGHSLDIEKLCNTTDSFHVKTCVSHKALCSVEGYKLIKKNMEEKGLDSLLIAACSPREKTDIFTFSEHRR